MRHSTAGDVTEAMGAVLVSPRRLRPRAVQKRQGNAPPTTVLIIDDEEPVRETLAEALHLHSYRAVTAATVQEAEDILQRLGAEAIQLVISDIHLTSDPQVRAGYALAQRWRTRHPGIPFILISGDPNSQDLPDIHAGVVPFLLKPFGADVLLAAVRDALSR